MTYDAAELARWRAKAEKLPPWVFEIIDALEKAQGEHDEIMISWTGPSATLALIAERDSARALLRSARSVIILGQTLLRDDGFGQGTLSRISKELAQ